MIKRNNCDRHDRKSPSPSKRGRVTAAAPEVPTHSDVKSGNTPAVNDELLTLVASYLSELGYKETVSALVGESGICIDADLVHHLREYVLQGDFSQLDHVLFSRLSHRLSSATVSHIQSLTMSQSLQEQHSSPATQLDILHHIRKLESPVSMSDICLLLLSDHPPPRVSLWETIRSLLPPKIVPPIGRLQELISQSKEFQISRCLHHTSTGPISLMSDHFCLPETLPTHEQTRLLGHRDEVWYLALSHCKKFIASASRDGSICVWDLELRAPTTVLTGHSDSCSVIAWSHDDSTLVSGSHDKSVRLWHPLVSNICVGIFSRHSDSVSAVAWVGSDRFVSGSFDQNVFMCDVSGNHLASWSFGGKVQDLVLVGLSMIAVASGERFMELVDVGQPSLEPNRISFPAPILTLAFSNTHHELLVSTSQLPPTIYLYDLNATKIIQKYSGHNQGRFVVRASFAGEGEQLVVCGSEDGQIFIWNKRYGKMLKSFRGHTSMVNHVVWVRDGLVTAGDDRTVRVWGCKDEKDDSV